MSCSLIISEPFLLRGLDELLYVIQKHKFQGSVIKKTCLVINSYHNNPLREFLEKKNFSVTVTNPNLAQLINTFLKIRQDKKRCINQLEVEKITDVRNKDIFIKNIKLDKYSVLNQIKSQIETLL